MDAKANVLQSFCYLGRLPAWSLSCTKGQISTGLTAELKSDLTQVSVFSPKPLLLFSADLRLIRVAYVAGPCDFVVTGDAAANNNV